MPSLGFLLNIPKGLKRGDFEAILGVFWPLKMVIFGGILALKNGSFWGSKVVKKHHFLTPIIVQRSGFVFFLVFFECS